MIDRVDFSWVAGSQVQRAGPQQRRRSSCTSKLEDPFSLCLSPYVSAATRNTNEVLHE